MTKMMQDNQKLAKALQFHQAGKLKEAEILYQQFLAHNKNNDTALFYYGLLCQQTGNSDKAVELMENAININPQVDYYKALGEIYTARNMKPEIINCYQRALAIAPNDSQLLYTVGMMFFKENLFEDALKCFQMTQSADPNHPEINYVLALSLHNLGYLDDAAKYYNKTIELQPGNGGAYNNLGIINYTKNKLKEAIFCFEKALSLQINTFDIYLNLTNLYIDIGEPQKAVELALEGLKIYPDNDSISFNLARGRFLEGEVDKGWEYFRYRRLMNEKKGLKAYLLDYQGSLEGKIVLVYRDTGFGDTIQFARYLPLLNDMGAKVICTPQSGLEELLRQSDLKAEIVSESIPPENIGYDFQINLTSLAYLFKADIDSFPFKDKYLKANPEKVAKYKEKYFNNDKLKVGIVWQALSGTTKSISDISTFLPLAEISNIKLYSLLKGEAVAQLNNLPVDITELGSTFNDFTDTAAAIMNLDLLVSVDTSVAHLGGALGKPTWILIPSVPNWRWFQNREDSPWYESVRLFRQFNPDSWKDVVEKIKTELEKQFCLNQ